MILGIDVGGTTLKWALFNSIENSFELDLVEKGREISEGKDADEIISIIAKLCNNDKVEKVGIGFPSVVREDGFVHIAPNLKEFNNIPLLERIKELSNKPISIDNDANVAALAELELGAAKEIKNFIYVTLGTGIGGALILNRELYKGDNQGAGEIGYTLLDYDHLGLGLVSNRIGILEEFIGRKPFLSKAKKIIELYPKSPIYNKNLDIKDISEYSKNGDEAAKETLIYYGRTLAYGLASVMNFLDIGNVIVGGGVSRVHSIMFKTLHNRLKDRLLPNLRENFNIHSANFLDDAGIFGAGILAIKENK